MRPRPHRRYPRNVHALVDYDYVQGLSPADRDYLDRFTEEYYGGSFGPNPLHASLEQRREINRHKARTVQDIFERGLRAHGDPPAIASTGPALGEDPARDPEYRETLAIFRAALPTDARRNVKQTPAFLALRDEMLEIARENTRDEVTKSEKVEKLRQTREIVWNLGVVVSQHPFPGSAWAAVPPMLNWLDGMIKRLNGKLEALGEKVEGPGRGEAKPKEGPNGAP